MSRTFVCTVVLVPWVFAACSTGDQTKPAAQGEPTDKKTEPTEAADAAAVPYFDNALAAVAKGDAPSEADTRPYGCSIKYADGSAPSETVAALGQPAPDFELSDLAGNTVKLSELKGKTVVLEWFNPECPFVEYAYTQGPLKELAGKRSSPEVVWLNINSGAPGKQGTGKELNQKYVDQFGIKHPVLLDETGEVGQKYGAKTTPHMYIVDPAGNLVYRGGLDNAPFGKVES